MQMVQACICLGKKKPKPEHVIQIPSRLTPAKFHCIKYYSTTKRLIAECADHPRCFASRSLKQSAAANREGQGRPLAWLWCWLDEYTHNPVVNDQLSHVYGFDPKFDVRDNRRGLIDASDDIVVAKIRDEFERQRRPGDAREPATVPR